MVETHNADEDEWVSSRANRAPTALPGQQTRNQFSVCKVLLVCESALVRHVLTRLLTGDARFEIVENVRSGSEVLRTLDRVRPHTVLFDAEISETEIKGTLRRMKERHARVGAVSCQPLEERCSIAIAGSDAALATAESESVFLDALRQERSDFASEVRAKLLFSCGFLTKGTPTSTASTDLTAARSRVGLETGPSRREPRVAASARSGPQALVIGCSTGGPSALTNLLPALPADFPLPVLIVQHMPPHFTKLLAERLARVSRIPVMEAEEGMEVTPGVALVAPGDFHMCLARRLHYVEVRLTKDAMENSCRPAVDVLFRSVAEIYSGGVIATVLTGMGQDGLKGVRVLKERGAPVFVQDRETSVVWGMPGAIAGAGLADSILPLEQIAPAILRLL